MHSVVIDPAQHILNLVGQAIVIGSVDGPQDLVYLPDSSDVVGFFRDDAFLSVLVAV